MNDLLNVIKYADDTSSPFEIKDVNDVETKVILDIVKICDWLRANKLSLNHPV